MPLWRRVRRPQWQPLGAPMLSNQTYQTIIQDMVDAHAFCQYPFSPGGAWIYQCRDSTTIPTSQWAAIGLIGANRAFGITIPKFVTDGNQVGWGIARTGTARLDTKRLARLGAARRHSLGIGSIDYGWGGPRRFPLG